SVVKGSSPRRILCEDSAARRDGEAPAPRHGAPDRRRAHGDALSARGVGGPAPPSRPGSTICGTRAADRDAVQRPRARAIQTVLLRSEEHTSELQSRVDLVCRLLLEKKKQTVHTSNDREESNSGVERVPDTHVVART